LTATTNLLVALSSIVLLAVLTKALSVADYGSWSLVMVTIVLIPSLVTLGLPAAMIRFLAATKDKRDIQEMFYSMGTVVLATSAIVTGLFVLFAPEVAASLFHSNLTAALILSFIIFVACLDYFLLQYFRAFQQMKRYSLIVFLQAYLQVAFVAVFIYLGYGLQGALTAILLQQLVVLFVMICLIVAQIRFAVPKFRHTREHIAYGVPLVPGILSSWIVNSSDRYLIGLLLGTVAVGYYSPGYALGTTIGLLSTPLTVTLQPLLSKQYDEKRIEDVRAMMKYSLKYYTGIAIPSVFALSVLSKPLLLVLSTPEIAANGYFITPFVAVGALLLGAYEVLIITSILKKKTAVVGTIWVISAALNFGLNLVLIPYLGIIGAAAATLLAFLLAFVLTAVYSFRHFTFTVDSTFIAKSVGASVIMCVPLLLWTPSGLLNIIISAAIAAVVYLSVVIALRGFTVQEIKLLFRIFKGF
jgi:O-antigen/teichoic acid export membrane protein